MSPQGLARTAFPPPCWQCYLRLRRAEREIDTSFRAEHKAPRSVTSVTDTVLTACFLVTFADIFSSAGYNGEIAGLPFAELLSLYPGFYSWKCDFYFEESLGLVQRLVRWLCHKRPPSLRT